MVMDNSQIKKEVFKALSEWNYLTGKATSYNISKKINCSESSVTKILRELKDIKLAQSSRGSWHLI